MEIMGGPEPGKLDPVLSAAMVRALMILRDYLDQIGFVQLYKFIATPRCYQSDPNVLSWGNQDGAAALGPHLGGDGVLPGLATALMLKVPVPRARSPRSSNGSPSTWSTPGSSPGPASICRWAPTSSSRRRTCRS